MIRLRHTSARGTKDWRACAKPEARLAGAVILFALSSQLCLPLFAQSPLAAGHLTDQEGSGGIWTNFQVIFSTGNTYSNTYLLTTNDAGRMITINGSSDPNFAALAMNLTNGEAGSVGIMYWVGPTNARWGSGFSEALTNFFDPLPPGNNGIDFQGFPINSLSLLIDTLTFTSPGSDVDGNGLWTDLDFAGRVFLNGDPLLLSTNISETAEVGDAIVLPTFVASSIPLACQWFLNGTNAIGSGTELLGSGPNSMQFTSVQLSNSGAYTLVVSNSFGALTSAPMVLNVVAAVAQRPVPAVYLTSQPGSLWTVVYSDSVGPGAQWTPLAAATLTNSSQYYFDTAASLPPNRFYQAVRTNAPAVSSALAMQIATAVTLTGNAGNILQVQYIDPSGPTNAWASVGTATLTNTTQLFFDVATIGQSPRIYRIIPGP